MKNSLSLKRALTAFGAVAACVVLTAMCGFASSCGTALHKSEVAADAVASSLNTAAATNHSLYQSSQISLQERQTIATYIDQAANANDAFIAQLKTAEANGGAVTGAALVQDFGTLIAQVNTLEQQGVLHLKSTAAQGKFELIMNAIKAQLTVIQTIVGSTSASNMPGRHPGNAPMQGGGLVAIAAIALTPEEIASLIGIATTVLGEGAALVQKLIAMKGESDAALLADASAQDADAEKQATADEGAS